MHGLQPSLAVGPDANRIRYSGRLRLLLYLQERSAMPSYVSKHGGYANV